MLEAMPLEIYCGLLHGFEIFMIPFLYVGILVVFLWGIFQYITRGDYDLYHLLGSKSLMVWAIIFLGVLMVVFSLGLLIFSFLGVTNMQCGF